MRKKEQKSVIYKGTHQDFSIKKDVVKKEDQKSAQKIYRGAILPILLALALLTGLFLMSGSTAHADTLAPSAMKYYLAEGRVGSGFRQWLTVSNLSGNACAVIVQEYYTLDGDTVLRSKTVNFTVNALTRYTDSVNNDLNIGQNAPVGATLSAIARVNTTATPNCPGIVVERPMYFTDFHGTSSGTNIIGATQLSQNFYFADVPTGVAGESFLAVFNPQGSTANVKVTYGNGVTHNLAVAANARGTIQPGGDNLPAHTYAHVTSDIPVLVERPAYFPLQNNVAGSADVVGVNQAASDWYFAEGYTGANTQENLIIVNAGDNSVIPTVSLTSSSGAVSETVLPSLAPGAQIIFDVNAHNTFLNATTQVAAYVHGVNLLVERQMFTKYTGSTGWSGQGVSDSFGVTLNQQTNLPSAYSYAEGFTSVGFNEWLELYNPGTETANITVTLVNMLGHTYSQDVAVLPHSRATVNVTDMVFNHLVRSGEDSRAYAVSMSVVGNIGFVSERTMYWNAFDTTGSSAFAGYFGN